jgi:peptidoglycan/xylan/chitin deacetylase (PgdA/CDA1 family)
MYWRRFRVVATLVVLLAAMMSLALVPHSAYASLRVASSTAALPAGSPTEGNKITLGETSIDGPSLWTSSTGGVRAVIAWSGTDTSHSLNLLSSGDGLGWGNKVTLGESSSFRPAVIRTGPGSSDSVVMAWIGTDPNQSLNILLGSPPSYTKLTLWQESSFTAPGIAMLNGSFYLVWAGTDPQHSLNIDRIASTGGTLTVEQKTTLWGWSSIASPSVVADPNGQRLLMSWIGPDERVHFATSGNGASWSQPAQSPMPEWSDASPMSYSSLAANVSSNLLRYFAAWRGIDSLHSVNVKYTTAFPEWPQSFEKATLNEQSFGGPVLGSVGASGQILLAWTGIDPMRHLNVATISVAYAAACVPASGVQPASPDVIWNGTPGTKEVSLTFDSDNGSPGNATTYLNILQNHHVHATFFLTGMFAQANPSIVKRIVSDGHDIGDHTIDHPDLANPSRTDTFVCNELTGADSTIAGIAGRSTRPFFRPPYGSYNEQVQYLAAGLGYHTIMWSIDPRDWDPSTTVQDILNRVLNSPNLGPGAIILMHVNSVNEPYALDGVITGLQQRGYTIVPLSQLLK